MAKKNQLIKTVTEEIIFSKIYEIRGLKVMLDSDLALLYGVENKRLKEAVRRNIERFPSDFMFELTSKEKNFIKTHIPENESDTDLRSQIATSSPGGSRYQPFAFTEQGIAMLSSVLNSPQAIEINIHIMRIFVRMRQMVYSYQELLERIEKIEDNEIEQDSAIETICEFENLRIWELAGAKKSKGTQFCNNLILSEPEWLECWQPRVAPGAWELPLFYQRWRR